MSDTPRRLQVSFSGGETSAFMAQWIKANWSDQYDEIVYIFANTGEENEETLEFVHRVDQHFGLGVVWVEAVVHPPKGKGNTHRVVSYETASRKGEPFEASIIKYGIPNPTFSNCTDKLKLLPMRSYFRSIGWGADTTFDTAIGIRTDEIDRMAVKAKDMRIVYPLISACPMTKPQVNEFWRGMPFRLQLKGYQGNCKACWKKTLRKHLTLMVETPDAFNFFERMEQQYGYVGPEFAKGELGGDPLPADYRRRFFRKNMTVQDIREAAQRGGFELFHDEAQVYPDRIPMVADLDTPGGGCSESCEVYHDGPANTDLFEDDSYETE